MPNILLYTTPLDIHSGGSSNFYLFFNLCKKNGLNVFLCPLIRNIDSLHFWSPFHGKSIEEITQEEIYQYFGNTPKEDIVTVDILCARNNVVIYPEDVIGNPSEQKYVVRWLHFFPIPQAVQNYSFENDYICFFSDYIFNLYDNLCKNLSIENHLTNKITKLNILRIFHFKNDFYKNKNRERERGVFIIRKGYPPDSFIQDRKIQHHRNFKIINKNLKLGLEYNYDMSRSHEQMVELYNSNKLFISYDPFTFTNIIASLCGCDSVVNKIPGLSYEEWKNSDPFHKYGLAYGIENIEEASKTRHLLEEHIYTMFLENENNLMNFIKDIELFFNIQINYIVHKSCVERYFFDTFGYITVNTNLNKNIINHFEMDISKGLNLPYLENNSSSIVGKNERRNNIRFADFTSDTIYNAFYNSSFLNELYKITDDFVILSPMESFHLTSSFIHRDLASEVKQVKILLYLDDVSCIEKGPLYVLPGTHNLYDKYSSSIGENVAWPTPNKGSGCNFCSDADYLNKNIPKTHICTNLDKIIVFNHNLFHGSDGNLVNHNILRRCIGMTLICVDRSNPNLMKKVDSLFTLYNVDNSITNAYKYCKKYNLDRWLKHFYLPSHLNNSFQHSSDGTDKNAIVLAAQHNRWEHYTNYFYESEFKNKNLLFNCFEKQLKSINKIYTDHLYDAKGL